MLVVIRLDYVSLLNSKNKLETDLALAGRQFLPFFENLWSCIHYLDSFEVARIPPRTGEECPRSSGPLREPWIFQQLELGGFLHQSTLCNFLFFQGTSGVVGEADLFWCVRINPLLVCRFIRDLILVGYVVVVL